MTDNTTPPAATTPEPSTPVTLKTTSRRRWITPALAVVAALAIGIFGGILIGHANASTTQASATQRGTFGGAEGGFAGGTGGAGGTGAAGGFTAGTIESIDGDTVTLKLTDGSTVKVTTSSTTTVTKSDDSTVSALKKGETITVVGAADSSGNVTATSVSEGTRIGGGTPPASTKG